MINILLADDHVIVRDGIKTLLWSESDIEVVAEASNGQEVISKIIDHEVDIVLMDINMPGMDGLEASSILKSKYPDVKIIALTMYREMNMIEAMFRNGAKAYLLKSCSKSELIEAIQGVYQGSEYLDEGMRSDFANYLNKPINKSTSKNKTVSKREKEVLQLISEEMTTAEIAKQLFISTTTVETHRKNLLRKLGLRNTAGLMRYAFEHSLLD